MRVPVLYGFNETGNFQSGAQFVSQRLGISLSNKWDGFADQEVPLTAETIQTELLEFIPEKNIGFSPEERFLHSLGKSSPELLMARNSAIERVVDAVIYPDYSNVESIVGKLFNKNYRAIIFGGGTSVSGSLLAGRSEKIVSIDTRYFKQLRIDRGVAVLGSGYKGLEAEKKLNPFGFTLGNFPESMLHSTVGGWVATKAIGQESNMYGGIENMVLGINMITSSGKLEDNAIPRNSAGFNLKDIAIGSDGKYGLITDVAMKLFKLPERKYYSSYIYESFKEGISALARSERFPAVARLSDELETDFAINTAGDGTLVNLYKKYINTRTHGRGALLVVVNNDYAVNPVLERSISAGSAPAKAWVKGRYSRPGLANVLWKSGLVPDTLETSTSWDNLFNLYAKVKETFYKLKDELQFKGEIMAHISHLYRSGACIYFTFILSAENDLDTLLKVRDGLVKCFISNGGSMTHHHGKGKFFKEYMNTGLQSLQNKLADPLFSGE